MNRNEIKEEINKILKAHNLHYYRNSSNKYAYFRESLINVCEVQTSARNLFEFLTVLQLTPSSEFDEDNKYFDRKEEELRIENQKYTLENTLPKREPKRATVKI